MDRDLSRFIAGGRLSCVIDKVDGVIVTNKLAGQNKTAVYEQVVKQGDILLSGGFPMSSIDQADSPYRYTATA